jgi:NAD(P)-dependent dehydrogenase (short-subunit alcohol dehydrogenase family)
MIHFKFKNKNFVLTGAGKGIGKTTLQKLYSSGANIAVITRSTSDIKLIKKNFKKKKVIVFQGDVSKETDIKNFFSFVKFKMKKIDGLVNNAGIRQREKFDNIKVNQLNDIVNTNLKSVFRLSQLFSSILNKKASSIVNISSIVGPRGFKNLSGYAMTKSGVIGLSKSLAVELAEKKIRVNTICPGFIKTSYAEKFKKNLPRIYKYTIERTPMKRWGTSAEVADLIMFLLSNNSSYITGNVFYIDGGWTSS